MDSSPTDSQLETIVRHLAKLHLEIERGVRDPHHLTRLMSPPAELLWLRTRERGLPMPGGPARDADVGPVHLRRDAEGVVYATTTTPTRRDRWGALTFVLQADSRTVSIRQATRLHAGLDYGRAVSVDDDRLHDRLGQAMDERRLVRAALEAAQVADGEHGRHRSETGPDTWRTVLDQLDTEITTLMRTDVHRHFHVEPPSTPVRSRAR